MAIEFRCIQCQKLLRVSDEAVGKKARCPDCGTIQEARATGAGDTPFAAPPEMSGPAVPPSPTVHQSNPFSERAGPAATPFGDPVNPYVAPSAPVQVTSIEAVRIKVQSPALALIIVGSITLALQLMGSVGLIAVAALGRPRAEDIIPNLVSLVISVGISSLMILGGRKMQSLESYGLAITAAVLAIVPCTPGCCMLTAPFGVWALVVLLEPAVKAAFEQRVARG